jgi:hypothetical protein
MADAIDDTTTAASDAREREGDLTRRRMIGLTVAAAIGAPILDLASADATAQAARGASAAPRFFSKEELALVDDLAEMIIPTDAHSPGARAAGVASYLDTRLAETWDTEEQAAWRAGLKAFDELSQSLSSKPILQASAEQRLAVLANAAKNEADPKTPAEKFFRQLKSAVAYGYYTSEIGIHKDIGYLGNTYQEEYAGYDVSQERADDAGSRNAESRPDSDDVAEPAR